MNILLGNFLLQITSLWNLLFEFYPFHFLWYMELLDDKINSELEEFPNTSLQIKRALNQSEMYINQCYHLNTLKFSKLKKNIVF